MDVFAHTLWTAAAAKGVNEKLDADHAARRLNVGLTAFFGVMPDLFAFTIPFVWLFWQRLVLRNPVDFIRPGVQPTGTAAKLMALSEHLYNISHSAIIFAAVFGLVWLLRGSPYWELSGWLLHIVIDIPTHTNDFFPTPVLWPLSKWHFTHGISWAEPWFMLVNYGAIAVVYLILIIRH